jgi:hypothetical protein
MPTLPFAEEIRQARQLSEEASVAAVFIQRVQATLQSLAIIDRQHRTNPAIQPKIPGSDVIETVVERWPALGGLADLNPAETATYIDRVQRMKLQQETVQGHLAPITAEEHERAHRLAQLQADQQQAMAAPEWAEIAARLRKTGAERDHLALALASARQKVAIVKPTQTALKAYLNQILAERDNETANDELRAARVRALATEAIKNVRAIATVSKLELGLPEPIGVSASPAHIDESIRSLQDLLEAIAAQLRALEQEVSHYQTTFDELTAELLSHLG